MSEKNRKIARGIIKYVGGEENIKSFENCMTRVRMTLIQTGKLDKTSLEKVDGVMGVVESGQQIQVIVGPSVATKVTEILREIINLKVKDVPQFGQADKVKAKTEERYKAPFSDSLKKISEIFIPLIPVFIASGLIMGINNLLGNKGWVSNTNITGLLGVFSHGIFVYMAIMVGMNAARVFGGSPAIGGLMGGITISSSLEGLEILGNSLVPGRGGVIGVILIVWFASMVEKGLRKIIPEILELILTPLLTVLISGFVAVLVLQPIGGLISDGIGLVLTSAIDSGGILTGFILAGLFLPLTMTGLHQGLTPIHIDLLDKGVNTLLPILAMAGAGQVGASIAVYVKTKNQRLKRTVASALPVGILGTGELLIYGVTLPLGKPFIGACIGGAIGGAIIAGLKVGVLGMGISGIPLAILVAENKATYYLLGVLGAYIGGFIATYLIGFDDPIEE